MIVGTAAVFLKQQFRAPLLQQICVRTNELLVRLIGHIDWASLSLFTAVHQVVSVDRHNPKYTRHSIQCVATWAHPANLTPTPFMKKSPYRFFFFFLFMHSCCSCSFSSRRRLHMLKAGSSWIKLMCGKVPIKLVSHNPHLQSFSGWPQSREQHLEAAVCR